jgi:hypothetical protein
MIAKNKREHIGDNDMRGFMIISALIIGAHINPSYTIPTIEALFSVIVIGAIGLFMDIVDWIQKRD